MRQTYIDFLTLVRSGIGHISESVSDKYNWGRLHRLAENHGLVAVLVDGIDCLPESKRPSKEILLEWIGEVLQNYEYMYGVYEKAVSEMASFYQSHGYKMMVLKGYACSLDWPKPKHRPCGDIDIWLFGKQKEADEAIRQAQGLGFMIDKSHHHHTVFKWGGFTVENHYDFVNIHAHRSSAELEKMFKELGKDDSHFVEVKNASTGLAPKVYLPSPNLHALFLIKHMVSHFAAAEISLRQVLDWGFFVEKHGKEVDWEWLQNVLGKYHMKEFFNLINAICVEDLGFASGVFPSIQNLSSTKDRVLKDILEPEYTAKEPKNLFPRLIYKYKRWQGNAWKQNLCYDESRWSAFWFGVWNHFSRHLPN